MATTGIHLGDKYRFSIDGTDVAKVISMNLQFSASSEQIQHKDNAAASGLAWDEPEMNGLSATASGQMFFAEAETFETFWTAFVAGTALTPCLFTTAETGDKNFGGDWKVNSLSIDTQTRNRVTASVELVAVGEITRGTNV